MLPEQFGYLTILISLLGISFYIKDTLKGKTKPNRVSWFIWMLAPFVAAFLQIKSGAGLSAIAIFMSGFISLLVLGASFFNKNAYWKITGFDMVCGILSVTAIVLWIYTKNSGIAIFFALLADLLAAIPTLVKSWKFPETETGFEYFCGVLSAVLSLLIIREWTFAIYSFGLYLAFINLLIFSFIYRKRLFLKSFCQHPVA